MTFSELEATNSVGEITIRCFIHAKPCQMCSPSFKPHLRSLFDLKIMLKLCASKEMTCGFCTI